MKTKILFTKQNSKSLCIFMMLCLCFNNGWSQELVKNGTCDEHGTGADTSNTSDNADAWDMTPNSTLNGGITSPYRYDATTNPDGWRNDALEDYIEATYTTDPMDLYGTDEQPGSTSSGNNGTRGVKLYDDADGQPVITQSTRRLYQRVVGLIIGNVYNFSIDSRSEAAGTPSQVYILNNEIADETGINTNGYTDTSVVAGMDITNDEGTWVTNTFSFTATTTDVVIYVRSLNSIDGSTEVFYDNISLVKDATASVSDFSSSFKLYPNPAQDFIYIESKTVKLSSVDIFNVLGSKIMTSKILNKRINVANLTKGVYFMKINAEEGGSVTKKVVIE
ncbi:T9SS type A sorting domain-containing protein [Algibacter luteus]|uniref:T9SS type A sorting domain-containing protein n=1 Tax=Algibacter luteus TaxID=1178825 RepID=UPI0025979713|nr:T9SS type A sorting domain-containing protein [Algibacter luteus]WJJ98180.1 T9SS type A sorting domain-containing protein [Algibacter luteus]